MKRFVWFSAAGLALGLVAPLSPGCSCEPPPVDPPVTEPPGPCDSETLENTVPASAAVTDAVSVDRYWYVAPLGQTQLDVRLLRGTARRGTLTVEQLDDGGMYAQLGNVQLFTRGRRLSGTRFAVESALVFADATTLYVDATFEDLRCAPVDGPREITCAPGVSLDPTDGLIVPSCGLDYDERLARGQAPTLTRLTYGVVRETPENFPPAFPPVRSFDAIYEREPAPRAERIAWLSDAGVLESLQTDDARRLLATYTDRAWSRMLAQHVAHCVTSGAFDDDLELELVDPGTQTQPLDSGDVGNYSNSGFYGNSDDDSDGASSEGDPHLFTFDGQAYDFQAMGEFVMARSPGVSDGPGPLEVQARMNAIGGVRDAALCRSVTFTRGVAVRFGDDVIEVRRSGDVLLNGSVLAVDETPSLADGRTFERTSSALELGWSDGTRVVVPRAAGSLQMFAGDKLAGTFEGLFGDADGDPANDLRAADGTPLPLPVPFDVLYGEYRATWAVTDESTLFTYSGGESRETYDDPDFPEGPADPALIPPAERGALEDECREAGATGKTLVDCVIDLYCTSDPTLADDVRDNAPVVSQTGGGLALSGDVVEAGYREVFEPAEEASEDGCTGFVAGLALLLGEPQQTLAGDLDVDASGTGAVTLSAATVPSGTAVRSFVLHIPPAADELQLRGSVRFSAPILGLQLEDATLEDGDVLVPSGASVSPTSGRGFEDAEGLEVSGDLRTLSFTRTQPTTGGDSLRVLVSASEEVTP